MLGLLVSRRDKFSWPQSEALSPSHGGVSPGLQLTHLLSPASAADSCWVPNLEPLLFSSPIQVPCRPSTPGSFPSYAFPQPTPHCIFCPYLAVDHVRLRLCTEGLCVPNGIRNSLEQGLPLALLGFPRNSHGRDWLLPLPHFQLFSFLIPLSLPCPFLSWWNQTTPTRRQITGQV